MQPRSTHRTELAQEASATAKEERTALEIQCLESALYLIFCELRRMGFGWKRSCAAVGLSIPHLHRIANRGPAAPCRHSDARLSKLRRLAREVGLSQEYYAGVCLDKPHLSLLPEHKQELAMLRVSLLNEFIRLVRGGTRVHEAAAATGMNYTCLRKIYLLVKAGKHTELSCGSVNHLYRLRHLAASLRLATQAAVVDPGAKLEPWPADPWPDLTDAEKTELQELRNGFLIAHRNLVSAGLSAFAAGKAIGLKWNTRKRYEKWVLYNSQHDFGPRQLRLLRYLRRKAAAAGIKPVPLSQNGPVISPADRSTSDGVISAEAMLNSSRQPVAHRKTSPGVEARN
jgi:hypothetical protein